MMTSFVAGGPLNPRRHGNIILERAELDSIIQQVTKRNNYLILKSPRQTGKTTLLFQIENRFDGQDQYCVVYLDLGLFGNNTEQEQFYQTICSDIHQKISKLIAGNSSMTLTPQQVIDQIQFRNYLGSISIQTPTLKKIVILINKIGHLNNEIALDLFHLLSTIHNRDSKFTFIVAGASELNNFTQEFGEGLYSHVMLKDFSPQQVIDLGENLQDFSDRFRKLISNLVYKWGNGHPYLTQRLFRLIDENKEIRNNQQEVNLLDFTETLIKEYIKEKIDPNVNYMVDSLLNKIRSDFSYNRTVRIYVNDGSQVSVEPDHDKELLTLGLLKKLSNGYLAIHNRMYKEALKIA